VPLGTEAPARIARAITPIVRSFVAMQLAMPMEVEPSMFIVVQRQEFAR